MNFSFKHSAHRIVQNLIYAIGLDMPQVFDYLDHRLLKCDFIKRSLNTSMKSQCQQTSAAWGDYGVTTTSNLASSKSVQEQLFVDGSLKHGILYDYFWLDVPKIYYPCKESYALMNALQNVDINTFSHPSVQIII